MKGKLFLFRQGNGYLILRGGVVYFRGRVRTEPNKTELFEVRTNLSVEEYKLYLASDPQRIKNIMLSPHPPYNLYVSFMREKKQPERNHIAEIGVDVNFPILVAAISVDGKEPFFVEEPFPHNKINKLLKRANKAQAEGNLGRKSMCHEIAARIGKGTYYRFIEKVHKAVRQSLTLKRNRTIKFIWHIENPQVLRNLHSQFTMQGWKPTILLHCLKEKQARLYVEIKKEVPSYTTVTCHNCGTINNRGGDVLKCEGCGTEIDWHRNAALNLLGRNHSVAGALFTPSSGNQATLGDFLQLHDKPALPVSNKSNEIGGTDTGRDGLYQS